MTNERFEAFLADDSLELTSAEIVEGWHFCQEFDGLLVSPSCEEFEHCTCKLLYTQIDTAVVHEKIVIQEEIDRFSLSNEELRKLAMLHPPPREWSDEDEEPPW